MACSLIQMPRNRWTLALAVLAGLLSLTVTGLWALSNSDWFQRAFRDRVVSSLEEATGARVELDDFSFSLFGRSVVIDNLSLSSEEDTKPLLVVESVRLEFGLDSLLRRRVSLRALELVAPRFRIETAEDGSLRLPDPPLGADGNLFDLIVGRFEIDRGSLFWDGTRYDLSLSADDLDIQTRYEQGAGRYWASILAGGSVRDGAGGTPLPSRAQAQLYVYRDHVELTEATVRVGKSSLRAEGEISGGEEPAAEFRYKAEVALTSPLVRPYVPWFSAGSATVEGSVEWRGSPESLAYRGDIRVHEAAGGQGLTRIEDGSASTKFWGGADELTAAPIRIGVLGTELLGSLQVQELTAAPRFQFAGHVAELDWAAKAAAVDGANSAMPWGGALSADIEVDGTADAFEAGVAIVLADSGVPPGRIPLKGVADLRYRSESGVFSIERLELATPSSQVKMNGTLKPAATSELLVHAVFETDQDVRALSRLAGIPLRDFPLQVAGASTFDGVIRGRWEAPSLADWTFAGRVEAHDVQLFDAPFERFTTHVTLSSSMARLREVVLEAGDGRAHLTLDLPLRDGGIASDLDWSADLTVEDLPAGLILEVAGTPAPVSGSVRGTLALRGTATDPHTSAKFQIQDGRAWDLAFDRFSGVVEHTPGSLSLQEMILTNGDARMDAKAAFNSDRQQFNLRLRTRDWPLTALPVLEAAADNLGGVVQFDLTGSGRFGQEDDVFEQLRLNGDWEIGDLSVADRALGNVTGVIETIGNKVALDWQGDILDGRFEGKAALAPEGPLSGEARFENVSAAALTQLVGLPLESLSGQVAGNCTFSNPSLRLEDFRAEGVIARLEAGLSEIPGTERGYEIWNPFPMRWSYAEQRLRLDRMRLLGEGTDIEINGTIDFAEPGSVDVDVAGTFNLAAVESFRPEITASGSSTIEIHARGAPDNPIVEGRILLKDGTLRSEDFPNGLSQINGQIIFDGDRARVEEVTAATGGGTVRLTGNVDFAEGPVRYRVNAGADRVRVRYGDSVSTILNGNLTLAGVGLRALLSGEVVIHRASISPEVDLGSVLAALGEPTVTPPSSPVLSNLQLNIQVGSVPDLDVETSLVRDMESRIDLRVTGTALQPSLLGRVSITEGRVGFHGTTYRINRGDIDFVNPFRIEPNVNFELETRVRDVDVALFLSGPARKMNLSFRSDPPLRFNELVSLIAAGRAPSQDPVFAARQAVEQQHLLQAGTGTVLSNALSRPVSSRLRRFFGVSRLRVDPQVGGAESDTSARIATEQQITSDLTLIYSYDLSSAQQQAVRVEWAPNRRWSIIFTRDENGLVGGDFLYKKRLR